MLSGGAPNLSHEFALRGRGFARIAGVDEVGRGSLAGPVVAAAVVLPLDSSDMIGALRGCRDSKKLPAERRLALDAVIRDVALAVGVSFVPRSVIDRRGIAAASRLAMHGAIRALALPPDALLIDAFALKRCRHTQVAFPKADEQSLSVAAASIVAKVRRDAWMTTLARRFPEYGFERHKGYGTREHLEALRRFGPSPVHRQSFAPIAVNGIC